MRRRVRLEAIAILAVCVTGGTALACGSPSEPTPTPTPGLTGTWQGTAQDSSGPGQMTWILTGNESSLSGTSTITDTGTNISARGSVTVTVSGSSLRFTLTVPVGGFDAPYALCSAQVSGDGQASTASMSGTYTGTNSCTGAIADGQFSVAKS
jgi:hypothetical protein